MGTGLESFEGMVRDYAMLSRGDKVLCAVSGGADSVCLLRLMLGHTEIKTFCAHYNHMLRGEESDRDEAFVKKLCRDWDVECLTERGDVAAFAKEKGLGLEEAARQMRYAFLLRAADFCGADRIATAHNAGDNAETVLFHLARGTGLKGLGGIAPVRGRLIRPLLRTARREIEAFLEENGLPHIEDSTNADESFTRNRIRARIIPELEKVNSAAALHLSAAAENLREDEMCLNAMAEEFIRENLDGEGSLPIPALIGLPHALETRVFRLLCPAGLEREHVRRLDGLCRMEGTVRLDLPGMQARKERGRLYFSPESLEELPCRELEYPGTLALPEAGLELRCEKLIYRKEIYNSFNTFYFQSGRICGKITVVSGMGGGSVRLAGRDCTKKLKKLFAEAGYTQSRRRLTPTLRDEAGILAVYGFGIAEHCLPVPGEEAIKVSFRKTD